MVGIGSKTSDGGTQMVMPDTVVEPGVKAVRWWLAPVMMVGTLVGTMVAAPVVGCGDDSSSGGQFDVDVASSGDTQNPFVWPDVNQTGLDTTGGIPDFGPADVGGATCSDDEDCAVDNPCVVAVCGAKGQCSTTPLVGKACDDGDPCTTGDQCGQSGLCDGGVAIDIPVVVCSDCSCDPDRGVVCVPKAPGASCDDGDCCTTQDRCAPCAPGDPGCTVDGLTCAGAGVACDDGLDCTLDTCGCNGDSQQPDCSHSRAPDGTVCTFNANVCTTGDECVSGLCVPGTPTELSDGNPCTQDVCVKGTIDHIPLVDGQCDDGDECTVGDHCFLGSCVGGGTVECMLPECAGSVECVTGLGCVPAWLPPGALCGGDTPCGGGFVCTADHVCEPSVGKSCDDGNACTTDACHPDTGACIHTLISDLCSNVGPCIKPQCNPESGLCDMLVPDGTPCPDGICQGGVCGCVPDCKNMACGDDGCGGSCGSCGAGLTCVNGACLGCEASCSTLCLPDGTCCPPDGFCPKTDTTLSGKQSFGLVYIPPGVTVTCVGTAPLELTVSGNVRIDGALRADGPDGSSAPDVDVMGTCGGFAGGDGFRSCTSSASTFCETSAASVEECKAWLSPKESPGANVCLYLANAPGEPGYGPGGGWGGQMAHPIHNGAPGSAGGGGGGSFVGAGSMGTAGSTICGTKPGGGGAGPVVAAGGPIAGGSGGGAGGITRAGACELECPLGCTAWGGDGGAGGGAIVINASGTIHVPGVVSARGGDGATSGGATCGGSGGGGSGGTIQLKGKGVTTVGPQSAHLVVTGGDGGAPKCPGIGTGGAGGAGALLIAAP